MIKKFYLFACYDIIMKISKFSEFCEDYIAKMWVKLGLARKYQVNRQAFRYLDLCAFLFRDLKNIKHSSTGKRKTKMAWLDPDISTKSWSIKIVDQKLEMYDAKTSLKTSPWPSLSHY